MVALAERVRSIPQSETLALNAKAKELRAQGKDVVNLTAGEPDIPTATHIIAAAQQALANGETRYTPVAGIAPLRQAIAEISSTDYGTPIEPRQVLVSCGAKHALFNAFQTLLNPGDEVIVPAPYWISYPWMIHLAQGKMVVNTLEVEQHFVIDPATLLAQATPKTKVVLINSPSNPTGTVQPAEVFLEVVSALTQRGIYVVTDDIYQMMTYNGHRWTSPFDDARINPEYVVAVNGASKTYCMTGLRIGWTLANAAVIDAMARVQAHSTSNATSISQWAALAALTGPREPIDEMRRLYGDRCRLVVTELEKTPNITCPTVGGAFYAFPDISKLLGERWKTDVEMAHDLLEKQLVATVPGSAFGSPGHLRLSFATEEAQIRKGLERFREFIA